MVNISIDVTDLGGEARPGDKVVFWRPRVGGSATHAGRVISTAPHTVVLEDGTATVPDVEPGEMRVLLQCRGVESQGPIPVTVPDGTGTVTLRSLIESQFEYAPPIVSAVQEAASNASASEEAAIRAQVRSEAAADRAEDRVDDAINNGANLIRAEVKQDADRAVSARQAATQAESNAKASESAAASSASRAKTSETNAKQSETNAGDYAAVATTAATEAVDAMDRVAGKADKSYVDDEVAAAKWYRGRLGSSDNLDDYRGLNAQGMYCVSTAVGGSTGLSGWVEVTYDSNSARTRQAFTPSSPNDSISLERKYSGGSWSAWRPAHWRGQPIKSGTIDTVTDPGQYPVTSASVSGIPISSIGSLEVVAGGSSSRSLLQRYVTSSSTPSVWVRPRAGAGWGPWVHVGGHSRHLGSTGDLNDEVLPGTLNITSSLVKNLPIAVVGSVEILPASGGVLQRFTSGQDKPQTFVRRLPAGGTWSAWTQSTGQAGESVERPRPVTYSPTETIKSSGYIPYTMSSDGMTGWNYNSSELRQTSDGGHTWQVARTFGGQSIEFVEQLANGELIVATTGTVDGVRNMRRVWVSTGYDRENTSAATWEAKITGQAPMVKFVDWCFYQHDNILLMNEYGPKSGYTWAGGSSIIEEGKNARYTWMSEDYGVTWSQVFDLNTWLIDNGRPSADGQHLHGVAWDKYWNRIWITFGDNLGGTATNGIIYSDDKGATWQAAHWTGTAESVGQVVGVQPMKDCIVFAGDMTPSGFLRINREGGKDRTEWEVITAWTYSASDLHLCHSIVHKEFPQGGEITLMGFSQEGTNSPSYIIATRDGYHTDLIWVDEQNRSLGLRTMAGPTDRGELIAAVNTGSGTVELRGVLDIFGTDWSTVYGLQDRMAELETLAGEKADKEHVHTAAEIADLHHYSGTGFPEGKVTAPVGATYVDTAATNGAIRWVKTSGTGSTGWTVEYGSTGSRDISSMLTDASGEVTVERIGQVVYLDAKDITPEETLNSGSTFLSSLPSGFRPVGSRKFPVHGTVMKSDVRSGFQHTNGSMGVWTPSTGDIYNFSHFWITANSWPASLPGTPL